jgi:NADH-quinone oxidoreductase subunit N
MNAWRDLLAGYLPELALALGVLATLGLGAAPSARHRRGLLTALGVIAAIIAAASLFAAGTAHPVGVIFRGFLSALLVPALLVSHSLAPRRHYAEHVALMLFSTTGMLLLAGANDLLTVFIALELAGLPLVALTALGTDGRRPAEAALKYFFVGAIASAFLLFGLSLVYGATGSLTFDGIRAVLAVPRTGNALLATGLVLVMGGFAFKVAAAPFHLWAPDVYEAAPAPAVAWIAAGSKAAGFAALVRFLGEGLGHGAGHGPVLLCFAAASMVVGNLAALAQTSVRRLLAFSAIAQGGYILTALGGGGAAGATPALFYAILYAVAVLGAFAVVTAVESSAGTDRLEAFAGLWKRTPGLALALLVFLITLAGLPPFPGFLGKLLLFTAALGGGGPVRFGLVVLAIALSAVSLYYYLLVLKRAFVDPERSSAGPAPRPFPLPPRVAAGLLAVALVWIAVRPEPLLALLRAATGPRAVQTSSMQSP